jgi:hypothetical protein
MAELKAPCKKSSTYQKKIRKSPDIHKRQRKSADSADYTDSLYQSPEIKHKLSAKKLIVESLTSTVDRRDVRRDFTATQEYLGIEELIAENKKSFLQHLPELIKKKRTLRKRTDSWSERCMNIKKADLNKTNRWHLLTNSNPHHKEISTQAYEEVSNPLTSLGFVVFSPRDSESEESFLRERMLARPF